MTTLDRDQDRIRAEGDRLSEPARTETLSGGAATWPLHPFLLGAASVFSLYAANLRETTFADVAAAFGAVLALTLILFLGFGAALRRFGPRAAILSSVALVGGLYYADLTIWLNRFVGAVHPEESALPWTLAAIAVALVAIWFARFSMALPNAILNGIAFVLLAVPVWQVGAHAWKSTYELPGSGASGGGAADLSFDGSAIAAPSLSGELPDIYYFIFDRYASQSVLLREYGVDNQDFIDFLKSRGFYVASRSHSNYLKTATSLASSLSMDYINFLSEKKDEYGFDWQPIYDMLGNHRVGSFLKGEGYTYVQIGSWWRPTQYNAFADENYSFGFSEFNWLYLRKTMLPPLLEAAFPGSNIALRLRWDNGQCHRAPQQMEQIKETGGRVERTFLFAHILLPHEPYVFDADGRCLSFAEVDTRGMNTGYVGQLHYTNTLLQDVISSLLNRPGKKPIIILQADEGPFPERYRSSLLSWREAEKSELQMKTGILNAYYFPDGDYSALYDEITPVNSFRMVFNKFFGTDFEHLPDRIYASPDELQIYEFFDVTDIVRGEEG